MNKQSFLEECAGVIHKEIEPIKANRNFLWRQLSNIETKVKTGALKEADHELTKLCKEFPVYKEDTVVITAVLTIAHAIEVHEAIVAGLIGPAPAREDED